MEVGTVIGRHLGLDFNSGKESAFGYELRYQGGDGVVFIDSDSTSNGHGIFELNVIIHVGMNDGDSTDINDFRQYATPVRCLMASMSALNSLSGSLTSLTLNQVDKYLVEKCEFKRVI